MGGEARSYTADIWVDGKIYRRFSVYDVFGRNKRWIRPALFAGILGISAVACFLLKNETNQAGLLGGVLLFVGLGFPAVYFGNYFAGLNRKIERLKIKDKRRHAYRITLSDAPDGIIVEIPNGPTERFFWEHVYMACRLPRDIYLYVEAGKAYILPVEAVGDRFRDIWQMMTDMLPASKRTP